MLLFWKTFLLYFKNVRNSLFLKSFFFYSIVSNLNKTISPKPYSKLKALGFYSLKSHNIIIIFFFFFLRVDGWRGVREFAFATEHFQCRRTCRRGWKVNSLPKSFVRTCSEHVISTKKHIEVIHVWTVGMIHYSKKKTLKWNKIISFVKALRRDKFNERPNLAFNGHSANIKL